MRKHWSDWSGVKLDVVNTEIDPTFRFVTVDWDGRIRMDPSSPYAMQALIGIRDRFDIGVACDTDHTPHGIVTRTSGLLPASHYLAVAADYLNRHRPNWATQPAVGKTIVSSSMIDRVTAKLDRPLHELAVGFNGFVEGLLDGSLGLASEESAGAWYLRLDGHVWTTDKDGIVAALLPAEITAQIGRDPGADLQRPDPRPARGRSSAGRRRQADTADQKKRLARLSAPESRPTSLSGEKGEQVLDRAPGNDARIGGPNVTTRSCWSTARPSGTEDIWKIYAEGFRGENHLAGMRTEAHPMVDAALGGRTSKP